MNEEEKISKVDQEIWDKYINDPKDINDKEINSKQLATKNIRLKFDLHGFTLMEANKKVEEIILSKINNYSEILLITGKGLHSNTDKNVYVSKNLSKLRFSIPEFIKSNKNLSEKVLSISTADINDGGEGALVIKLKKLHLR